MIETEHDQALYEEWLEEMGWADDDYAKAEFEVVLRERKAEMRR